MSLLPAGVRVVIAGREGNASEGLRALCQTLQLGDRVTWLGRRDDVADLMVASDVLALPSRWEGLGGVLLEAMALGCPIVASDLPITREVAGDPSNFVFVGPEKPADLAAAIELLRGDESRRASMQRSCLERFDETFSISSAVDGMIRFYERSIALG